MPLTVIGICVNEAALLTMPDQGLNSVLSTKQEMQSSLIQRPDSTRLQPGRRRQSRLETELQKARKAGWGRPRASNNHYVLSASGGGKGNICGVHLTGVWPVVQLLTV
jgi:hypothetical protein